MAEVEEKRVKVHFNDRWFYFFYKKNASNVILFSWINLNTNSCHDSPQYPEWYLFVQSPLHMAAIYPTHLEPPHSKLAELWAVPSNATVSSYCTKEREIFYLLWTAFHSHFNSSGYYRYYSCFTLMLRYVGWCLNQVKEKYRARIAINLNLSFT